jgi:hypothetical protein
MPCCTSSEIRFIAQLTGQITTHLCKQRHEIKFHIASQFNVLEINVIIETDKIVFGWIIILMVCSTVVLITTECLDDI